MPKANQMNPITKMNPINGTKDGQMVRNITRVVRSVRILGFADLEQLFEEVAGQSGYETDKTKCLKRYNFFKKTCI